MASEHHTPARLAPSPPPPPPPLPPSSMPAKMTLEGVGPDVQCHIFAFITRPKDLVNLMLTSKTCHEIALPLLYREITLDIGSPDDGKLTSFINPSNPGLKHIRVMDLYLASPGGSSSCVLSTALTVRMILEFLPKNQLEKFRWHPWESFNAQNLALLFANQKKLNRLEAIAFDETFESVKQKINFDETVNEHVHTLGLYPDSDDVLRFSHEILKRKTKLEKLTISTHFDEMDDMDDLDDLDDDPDNEEEAAAHNELNDSPLRPGRIVATLFQHMMPLEKCIAIHLNDLTLEKVYLRYAPLTYCRALNFPQLTKLKVIDCTASGALFAELCKSAQIPQRLQVLEITHATDRAEGELTKALNEFLCLVSGLRELSVEIGGTNCLISVASIIRHRSTLRVLSVHGYREESFYTGPQSTLADSEKHYCTPDFRRISKECTGLRQLSLAFPPHTITNKLGGSYGHYVAAIAYHLRDLVTLQISNWPSPSTSPVSSAKLSKPIYEQLLQHLAQEAFDFRADLHGPTFNNAVADETDSNADSVEQTLREEERAQALARPRKLNLVAFGTSDRDYDRKERTQMAVFARGRKTHPITGKVSIHATKIGWNERRWWEPESDVLDWALQRGGRMPVKADDGDSDGWGPGS